MKPSFVIRLTAPPPNMSAEAIPPVRVARLEDAPERKPNRPLLCIVEKESPSLAAGQAFVEGFVEIVNLPDGRQMVVNEDGLHLKLPYNHEASKLYGGVIVGHAFILERAARWT